MIDNYYVLVRINMDILITILLIIGCWELINLYKSLKGKSHLFVDLNLFSPCNIV